jgi:xanthine phosphoribosyltransferase
MIMETRSGPAGLYRAYISCQSGVDIGDLIWMTKMPRSESQVNAGSGTAAVADKLYALRQDLLDPAVFYADDLLTHSIDPDFIKDVTRSFASSGFARAPAVDAVLTAAISGIPVGVAFAQLLEVRCIVARKEVGRACRGPFVRTSVVSYTGEREVELSVSERQFAGVRSVLLADDFLSTGSACIGLLNLCNQVGVRADQAAVVFAKPSQGGCQRLTSEGTKVWAYRNIEARGA